MDVKAFVKSAQVAAAETQRRLLTNPKAEEVHARNISQGAPFYIHEHTALNTVDPANSGQILAIKGHAIHALRRGSHPGLRTDLVIDGVLFEGMAPGESLIVPFNQIEFRRNPFAPYTSSVGVSTDYVKRAKQRFLILTDPNYHYKEPADIGHLDALRWPLLGDVHTGSYEQLTEDTTPEAWFTPQGFRRLRVYLDMGADGVNTMTSVSLIPWAKLAYMDAAGAAATAEFEMGLLRIDIPDSLPTAQRYRSFLLDVPPFALRYKRFANALSLGNGMGCQMGFLATDFTAGAGFLGIAVEGAE